MALLGAHESVAGGLHLAFERIDLVGGEALQIFTRNQRQWRPKPLAEEEVRLFRQAWAERPEMVVASHASYLINMASSKEELQAKSAAALGLELERCHLLGIPYVVLHPGSHGGDGEEAGLARCVAGLDTVLAESPSGGMVLLETTAGQGTGLGRSFEELGWILGQSQFPGRLGVCLDTCHLFAAGYDPRSPAGYDRMMAALERWVGLDRVRFVHLNDSKREVGSRVDRHAHIGQGELGLAPFRHLLNDPRFKDMPMTLETPKGADLQEDVENLRVLRSLIDTA